MARENSPLLEIERLEITSAEEEINEIFGTFLSPKFELVSYGGLISDARGDYTTTSDSIEDYSHLGPFTKIDLTVIQPFYSFGKYGTAMNAGKNNLEMKTSMLRETSDNLGFEVTKAYLGIIAGLDGSQTGNELLERYEELLERIDELQQEPDSDIDASYLLEAKALFFDIKSQASKPTINKDQAQLYLAGLLNLEQGVTVVTSEIETPELNPVTDLVPSLNDFFHKHSPVIQSLDSGLKALKEKAALEKKKSYPDLFVAIGAGYGVAPGRDKQTNPFIADDYNYKKIGAVLGLKWNFNYHVNNAKERKAFISYQKIVQKKKLLLLQREGMIKKFHNEALRNQNLLHAATKSLKSAKTWLRLESENLDLGIGDVKRLVKAYQAYYQLKGNEIETRYHYLLSLAQLAKTTGDLDLFLLWIQNDKVQLN